MDLPCGVAIDASHLLQVRLQVREGRALRGELCLGRGGVLGEHKACAKVETECAVLNAGSVCFSRLTGGQHAPFEHPNTGGKRGQVLEDWEESSEGRGLCF